MINRKSTPVSNEIVRKLKDFLKTDSLKRFKTFQKSTQMIKENRVDNAIWIWKEVIDNLNQNVEEKKFANFLWNYWFPNLNPIWKIDGETPLPNTNLKKDIYG